MKRKTPGGPPAERLLLGKSWCLVDKEMAGYLPTGDGSIHVVRGRDFFHKRVAVWIGRRPAGRANPAHLSCLLGPLLCPSDKRG